MIRFRDAMRGGGGAARGGVGCGMDTGCKARTKAGTLCKALPFRDGWCRWHHPDLEAERQRARVLGGENRATRRRARKVLADASLSPLEVAGVLSRALVTLEAGDLEPGVASAMATVARALLAVRASVDVEDRLRDLEARLGVVRLDDRRTA